MFVSNPTIVLFTGYFLALMGAMGLFGIAPIMVRTDENRKISFYLTVIGVAIALASRS